jgi:PAS domain S-box-containing protein
VLTKCSHCNSDTKGNIVHANMAAVDMFGYKLSELVGQNVTILMEPSLRAIHHDFIERYLRTREPRVLNTRDRRVVGCNKAGKTINCKELSYLIL